MIVIKGQCEGNLKGSIPTLIRHIIKLEDGQTVNFESDGMIPLNQPVTLTFDFLDSIAAGASLPITKVETVPAIK